MDFLMQQLPASVAVYLDPILTSCGLVGGLYLLVTNIRKLQ